MSNTIKFRDVPVYLHDSEYYVGLKENGCEEDFEIDIGNYSPPESSIVNTFEEFKFMFAVVDRFGSKYSLSFMNYIDSNKLGVVKFLIGRGASNNQILEWSKNNIHLEVAKFLIEKILCGYSNMILSFIAE